MHRRINLNGFRSGLGDLDLASGEFFRIHVCDADFGVSFADSNGEEDIYRYGHG